MNKFKNPNTGKTIHVKNDNKKTVINSITKLKENKTWKKTSFKKRKFYIQKISTLIKRNKKKLCQLIGEETGKPLWESELEVSAAINKSHATLVSYDYRCKYPTISGENKETCTIIKPIGNVGVIGPYNFPIHIPHGQIIPALLTGNTVIMKSSEYCIQTTKFYEELWKECFHDIQSPIKFIYGNHLIGKQIVENPLIDFIFFTGSFKTGRQIETKCLEFRKPLALEMGGNNPLIIEDNHPAIIKHIIMSSFISAGQRCSCSRRVIINKKHEKIIDQLISTTKNLKINSFPNSKTTFMGPVVLEDIKNTILDHSFKGSETLLNSNYLGKGNLITPRIELSKHTLDQEIFGPIIFIYLTDSFDESLHLANDSDYGLTASVYTNSKQKYNHAIQTINAGVINLNNPTTGASSMAPFGGIKNSGNYHPGGFNMIDHCVLPTSSTQSQKIHEINFPGI